MEDRRVVDRWVRLAPNAVFYCFQVRSQFLNQHFFANKSSSVAENQCTGTLSDDFRRADNLLTNVFIPALLNTITSMGRNFPRSLVSVPISVCASGFAIRI